MNKETTSKETITSSSRIVVSDISWENRKELRTEYRYVDDSFCVIKKDEIPTFHNTLNSMDPHISFTIEQENNGQIPFLDTLISRKNGTISINIYRKPTHTERYLDFNSHHDKKHKVSTAATLLPEP